MRAYTPKGDHRYRISSGTEDYFLGTFYFNKGEALFLTYTRKIVRCNKIGVRKIEKSDFVPPEVINFSGCGVRGMYVSMR